MKKNISGIVSALPVPGTTTLVFGHRGAMAYAPPKYDDLI